MKKILLILGIVGAMWASQVKAHETKIVVLELYTSQGCSSCPWADRLMQKLMAEDASLLPLSFHVTYWDHLGWKDPFASHENTERQKIYNANFGVRGLYTPELVVDGAQNVVGSYDNDVREAIRKAKAVAPKVDVKILPDTDLSRLLIKVSGAASVAADVWGVHYNSHSTKTAVLAGENSGQTVEGINNVTSMERLGSYDNAAATYQIGKPVGGEGLVVIVQASNIGPVLGAASYVP